MAVHTPPPPVGRSPLPPFRQGVRHVLPSRSEVDPPPSPFGGPLVGVVRWSVGSGVGLGVGWLGGVLVGWGWEVGR